MYYTYLSSPSINIQVYLSTNTNTQNRLIVFPSILSFTRIYFLQTNCVSEKKWENREIFLTNFVKITKVFFFLFLQNKERNFSHFQIKNFNNEFYLQSIINFSKMIAFSTCKQKIMEKKSFYWISFHLVVFLVSSDNFWSYNKDSYKVCLSKWNLCRDTMPIVFSDGFAVK